MQLRREEGRWVSRDLTRNVSNAKRTIVCDDIPRSVDFGTFANVRRCSIHAAVELHVFIFNHMSRGSYTVSLGTPDGNKVYQHSQYSENSLTNFAVVGAEKVMPRRKIASENKKNSAWANMSHFDCSTDFRCRLSVTLRSSSSGRSVVEDVSEGEYDSFSSASDTG